MAEYQKGQVLLLVVLVMIVALTIGLSVVSRTITNNRITSEEENSEQAFSAAEAGLEQSLQNNANTVGTLNNNTTYKTTIVNLSGTDILLNNGSDVLKDDPVDVWLSQYPQYSNQWSGTLTVFWGKSSDTCAASESTNTRAALDIVLLRGSLTTPQMTHFPVDPCATRATANKFESIGATGGTVSGKTFGFSKTITITAATPGLFMRIIPLYAPTAVAVRGSTALPSQGTRIEAVGTADQTQRKIVSFTTYPSLPTELFPFVMFSPK